MRSRIRHPGDKAFQFTLYLSCNKTYDISLRSESCLCNACYIDCERASGKPRWLRLSKFYILKHCILCCQGVSSCTCTSINAWGPDKWYENDSEFQLWLDYFRNSEYSVMTSESCMGYSLCKTHYVNMRTACRNRACKVCGEDSSVTKWMIGQKLLELLGPLRSDYDLAPNDWVCGKCYNDIGYSRCSTGNRKSRFCQVRDEVLESTIKAIDHDGACLIKYATDKYMLILENNYTCINEGEYESFKRYLKVQLKQRGYELYSPTKTAGSMCYNPLVFSDKCLLHIYKFLNSQKSGDSSNPSECVRTMVKRQVKLFPTGIKFDYRKIFDPSNNKSELEKYFDTELLQFVNYITLSNRITEQRQNNSDKYRHSRNIKCMMVCAILANMMDARSCCLQTLIGLACYAQGLRDKGIKVLNAFGITNSVSHIREHGSWWAKIRKAVNEIDVLSFWRVTFDNLDFKMKFAKKISAGGGQLNRMLHLLTSQVSFRSSSQSNSNPLAPHTANPIPTENNFKLEHENSEWLKFCNSVYDVSRNSIKDDANFEKNEDPPLLDKLKSISQIGPLRWPTKWCTQQLMRLTQVPYMM